VGPPLPLVEPGFGVGGYRLPWPWPWPWPYRAEDDANEKRDVSSRSADDDEPVRATGETGFPWTGEEDVVRGEKTGSEKGKSRRRCSFGFGCGCGGWEGGSGGEREEDEVDIEVEIEVNGCWAWLEMMLGPACVREPGAPAGV
jgi:hypothetical protein